ncbi:MAG: hypothetical protein HY099_07405, partial [Nitrospirae bacterium]|nr:hypothetical protein [Nitrospirota bacterium]
DSLILLVASNPDRLPDTIRSRCINVRFYPLPAEGFKKVIAKNVKADDMDVVLRLSMGRPGLALSGDFADEKERFMKFLDNMLHGESKDAWTDKDAIRSWLDMSSIFLRDIVVFNITGSESDLICVMGRHKAFKNIPASNVFDAYQSLQKLRGLLDFNLNKSISWNYAAAIMRKCVTG